MSKKAIERRHMIARKHNKDREERATRAGVAKPKGLLRQAERVIRQKAASKDNEAYYQSGTEWQTPR